MMIVWRRRRWSWLVAQGSQGKERENGVQNSLGVPGRQRGEFGILEHPKAERKEKLELRICPRKAENAEKAEKNGTLDLDLPPKNRKRQKTRKMDNSSFQKNKLHNPKKKRGNQTPEWGTELMAATETSLSVMVCHLTNNLCKINSEKLTKVATV